MSKYINIIILEPSAIICQGITSILSDAGLQHKTVFTENLRKLEESCFRHAPDIVLVNPVMVQNQLKELQGLKKKFPDTYWIAIIYALTDQHTLSFFDDVIYINDTPGKIINSVQKLFSPDFHLKPNQEVLSERETEVLKLLVAGKANKEIADKLNISTHTVITHRKNISQKTGIKSVSGLTIYAVLKDIISVNDYMG